MRAPWRPRSQRRHSFSLTENLFADSARRGRAQFLQQTVMLPFALRHCTCPCGGTVVARAFSISASSAIAPRRAPREDGDASSSSYERPAQPRRSNPGGLTPDRRSSSVNQVRQPRHVSDREAERRESLHRERQARTSSLNESKQYALARERQRVLKSNWEKKDDVGRRKLEMSARATGASMGGVSSAGAVAREGTQAKWKRGERRDRAGGKGMSTGQKAGNTRLDQTMVPGRINRGTAPRAETVDRNAVKPVVRGGLPRSGQAGGQRRKRQPKVLKKVTLPSTVRLENLTRILGVKLCELRRVM